MTTNGTTDQRGARNWSCLLIVEASNRQIESRIETLPRLFDASLDSSESSGVAVGVVPCSARSALVAFARCASGANVAVTIGQPESLQSRKLGTVTGLELSNRNQ